jgi:hypothetical protein
MPLEEQEALEPHEPTPAQLRALDVQLQHYAGVALELLQAGLYRSLQQLQLPALLLLATATEQVDGATELEESLALLPSVPQLFGDALKGAFWSRVS